MLLEYIRVVMRKAVYKILEDGSYFGEIQGFKGVWADASNLEDCRENLQSTLEEEFALCPSPFRRGERCAQDASAGRSALRGALRRLAVSGPLGPRQSPFW